MTDALRWLVFLLSVLAFGLALGALVCWLEERAEKRARKREPTLSEYVRARESALWREALKRADEAQAGELLERLAREGQVLLDAERSGA